MRTEGDPAAVFAKNTGPMSVVDVKCRVIEFSQLQQVRQRRNVAVLAEDPIGNDDFGRGV